MRILWLLCNRIVSYMYIANYIVMITISILLLATSKSDIQPSELQPF